MVEVHDAYGTRETEALQFPVPGGAIAQIDHFSRRRTETTTELVQHHRSKGLCALSRGHIGGRVQIAPRRLAGDRVLSEKRTDFDLMGLRAAIGLTALAALEFVMSQGSAGAVGSDINPGRALFPRRQMGSEESFGQGAQIGRQSRKLSGVDVQAGIGMKRLFGLPKGVFGGAAAHQGGHSRRIPIHQSQGFVHRKATRSIGAVVIVVANQRKIAKEGMHGAFLAAHPALARTSGVAGYTQVRQGQQPAQELVAHALRGLPQAVLQPRDIAQLLAVECLGRRIHETVQFLRPSVYRLVGFFLLSDGGAASIADSSKWAIWRSRACACR